MKFNTRMFTLITLLTIPMTYASHFKLIKAEDHPLLPLYGPSLCKEQKPPLKAATAPLTLKKSFYVSLEQEATIEKSKLKPLLDQVAKINYANIKQRIEEGELKVACCLCCSIVPMYYAGRCLIPLWNKTFSHTQSIEAEERDQKIISYVFAGMPIVCSCIILASNPKVQDCCSKALQHYSCKRTTNNRHIDQPAPDNESMV